MLTIPGTGAPGGTTTATPAGTTPTVGRDPWFLNNVLAGNAGSAQAAGQARPGVQAPQPVAAPATDGALPATKQRATPTVPSIATAPSGAPPVSTRAAATPLAEQHATAIAPGAAREAPARRARRLRDLAARHWLRERLGVFAGPDGVDLVVRNYFLTDDEAHNLVADLLAQLAATGDMPDRIVVNGQLAWTPANGLRVAPPAIPSVLRAGN